MVLRYFIARLKKTILPTIGVSFALSIVVFLMVIVTAMPDILGVATENHSRRISGDADLVLTNSYDSSARFFGLTALREDEILTEHAEYIYGLFWTYAQLDTPNGRRSFGTVFAGDLSAQNMHNPLAGIVPGQLSDFGIIIGEEFAEREGIRGGHQVHIVFGGRRVSFAVQGIARNEGLLADGNAVFISSAALSRFIPFLGSGIVTHAFIRANCPRSLQIIAEHLSAYYPHLSVSSGGEIDEIQRSVNQFVVHISLMAFITAVFCLISLFILLRLAFSRDRQNFERLSALGLSKFKLALISALYGLLLCVFGIGFALIALQAVLPAVIAASPLLAGYNFGFLPYAVGIGSGLAVGTVCAILSIFAPKTASIGVKRKLVFYAIGFAIVGAGIIGVLIAVTFPHIALLLLCFSLLGLIFFLPKIIAPITAKIHDKTKNIYTLRLKTLAHNKSYNNFVSFGLIVTLVMVLGVALPLEVQSAMQSPLLPFDTAVIAITDPSAEVFERVTQANGVQAAVRAEADFRANLSVNNLEFGAGLFGLDEEGFVLFGADFDATALFDGRGAVVGDALASRQRLRVGDEILYSRQGRNKSFVITKIIRSDYLDGRFVLVDLDSLAVDGRPYSDILIASYGDLDYTMQAVAMVGGLYGAVLDVTDFLHFVFSIFGEFAWLLNWFSTVIISLALATILLMIIIRRIAEDKAILTLTPLGLTKQKHLVQTLFSVCVALLAVMISIPMLVFLLENASLSFFFIFGLREAAGASPIITIPVAIMCFIFIITVEVVVAAAKKIERQQ